ncbi:MAG TPA: anaerobic ribonucleoside-triphosphate reductase activating protein [Bacteroidales bacterium]|nr:anaerobic ribonucleoside-triphosphate reductase activating protein [Bacteroidales bacterium]
MLKYVDYDIVFQEIPDEVSLAINLSNCPHRCEGCHSPQLQSDIGEPLNENVITELLEKYGDGITCVCFMGGDSAPDEVCRLAEFIRLFTNDKIKTAWYSGCKVLNTDTALHSFNYIKLGPYIEHLGPLNKKTTNQKLFKISQGKYQNITYKMWK